MPAPSIRRALPIAAIALLLPAAACSDGGSRLAGRSWTPHPFGQLSAGGKRDLTPLDNGQGGMNLTLGRGVGWNGCALRDDTDWNDLPASRCDGRLPGEAIFLAPGVTMADGCVSTGFVSVAQVNQGIGVICPLRQEAAATPARAVR